MHISCVKVQTEFKVQNIIAPYIYIYLVSKFKQSLKFNVHSSKFYSLIDDQLFVNVKFCFCLEIIMI